MKYKILVIDDEHDLLEGIIDMLSFEGYEVGHAHNGKEGYDQIFKFQPDLVICDVLMPEISGLDLVQKVRSNPESATLPFIFISALAQKEEIRTGMNLGADDYLVKPFTREELLNTVKARLASKVRFEIDIERRLDEFKNNILGALPHELYTPLNSIIGFSDLIESDIEVITKEQIVNMARIIHSNGNRLHNIVKKFLLFIDLEVQKTELEKRSLSLKKEIIQKINVLSDKYKRFDDISLSGEDFVVFIEPEYIDFVLHEIIDNAFKFSEAGSAISIELKRDGCDGIIVVQDNGIGFSLRNFESFKQADRSKYEQQGVGLGLYLSNDIISKSDGTISILNIKPNGTEVTIKLPLCKKKPEN